jgi:RNA-binding protein Musashi
MPREHFADSYSADPSFKTNKIFVGGLPPELSDREFKEFFTVYGEIKDCVIIPNKETKQSRCFGFVEFVNPESVDQIIERNFEIKLAGRLVDIKKALPKETCNEIMSDKNGVDRSPNYGKNYVNFPILTFN